jgi:dihydrodipicolinate synthase/N-acetylneuraminate lyase
VPKVLMETAPSHSLESYAPRAGLSIPLVTVLDNEGRIIEAEQRALVRFAVQDGAGADILFAAGTTGEWDRMDNPRRQEVSRIVLEECRRCASAQRPVEVWFGITAHTRRETVENLVFALEIGADAAVIAPLSVRDVEDPVDLVTRELGEVFERAGRAIPVFLYDNSEIHAPGQALHLHTRDVKRMSQVDYIRGIKVTANKSVLGNYTRAASHFRLAHEFAVYAGNPLLIFDLFAPAAGLVRRARHYWNRYLTQGSLPYGIVAGPANPMPREWQRAWQICRARDAALMEHYRSVLEGFRDACRFARAGTSYQPAIACLKAALVELGVIASDAVARGTPSLDEAERREFARRFAALRERSALSLEPGWVSRTDLPAARSIVTQQHA